ncbi:MAG TPA: hypothetical protein VKV74_15035 [Bryobacteraceae bacterium]|nr:hypothetical protein [Bryobacteraceae bacterium]
MVRSLLLASLAAAASAWAAQPGSAAGCAIQPLGGQWPATAQFVSGLDSAPFASSLAPDQTKAWDDYSKTAASDWRNLEKRYLSRIEAWRGRALASSPGGGVAFYPFGGPDSANLFAFFPDAREYVIVGLEPVGCIPSSLPDYTHAYFAELRENLSPVASVGFFRTKEMGGNFKEGSVNGVLPLLIFLMARSGCSIQDVTPIVIAPSGALASKNQAGNQAKIEAEGVAIRFTDARHGSRTLKYFALNLQNSRLNRKPGALKYLNDLPAPATLIKSASYLLHKTYFSTIRNLILSKSGLIVEDDSGIPYRYFDGAWDVRLYGKYSDPIALFKNWRQPDLKEAFASRKDVPPLDFAIGYRHAGESNLLVALRRAK